MTESKDLEELLSAIKKLDTTAALVLFKNLCGKGKQIILSDFLLLVHKKLFKSCPQSNIKEPLQSVAKKIIYRFLNCNNIFKFY